MAFTKSTVATNNISALPNKPLITATALKQKFDQYGADDKTYVNTLIDELEATTVTSGAENIGSKTISGLAGNTIWAQLSALWTAVQNIVIGTLPDNSVTNDKIATASKIGLLADLTTSVKTNIVAAINSIAGTLLDGVVTWAKLAPDMQNRELTQDKAITELLMLADIDSKVFSPNLGKFYTNFSTAMDYSLGTVDSFKQTYTGTLSAGATNVVLPSVSGLLDGQEISVQDGSNYEDVIVDSIVSTTVSFKTALVNSYTNPDIYRSNNSSTTFGGQTGAIPVPTGSVFGLHFDSNMSDFVGALTVESDTGTYDTTNKVFGAASKAYNGSQYTQYADSSVFDLGSGNWYIKFRVRRNSTGSQFIFGQSDNATSAASTSIYSYFSSGNVLTTNIGVGGTPYAVNSTTVFTNTTDFYAIAIGRDGNFLRVWVNGVLEASAAISGTINNSTNKFCIGRAGEYASAYLNGKVDEFLLVKGQTLGSSNYTVETNEFGYGSIQLTKNVIRMNITPYEDVKYISAWLTKTDLAGFTADGKLSIVDAAADESYVDLTESITDLGATQEVMMIGNSATADSKVTLKLVLNRASTSDSVSFTKLIGGVSA